MRRRRPDLIVVGPLIVGGLFFAGLLIFDRDALETAPEMKASSSSD